MMSTQSNGHGNGNGNKPFTDASVSAESDTGSAVSGRIAPSPGQLKKADFVSDQEVRWCPGCGDYAILNNVQKVMPELGLAGQAGGRTLEAPGALAVPRPGARA